MTKAIKNRGIIYFSFKKGTGTEIVDGKFYNYMTKYLLESLENGSHGIIPTEDLNYFVGNKRITVYKDGKKIIDKEVQIDDDGNICKYNIICDDDKDPELIPATDVEEYNVANMLPQVYPEGSVLRKEEEEDYEEITIDDNITEAAAEVAAIVGGTVVLTGILAAVVEHEVTKRKAIDWYADQYEVSPKFSELKKKNYKVKYNNTAKDVTPTDKEKLINFDKNNVAEIYYYNDKRAFGVIYGCNVENFIWMPGYTLTTYRINVRIVVYNPDFKKHIEYYAAKSMIKHQYTMRSIDDWIRGIMSDYRKFKKDEKKAEKAQKKIKKDPNIVPDNIKESEFDFSNDLDTVLETCDNILSKIEAYSITNESTNEEIDEVITESSVVTEENIMHGEEAGEPINEIDAGQSLYKCMMQMLHHQLQLHQDTIDK